jgi:E3 ubiquitin-protein ligase TRIP12
VASASDLEQYLEALVDATLGRGVAAQLSAFREGFNEVFSLR